MINSNQIIWLKELSERMGKKGFSWQHEDYFNLQDIVPEILCHVCINGDKNNGICMECFNEKHFKYYIDVI